MTPVSSSPTASLTETQGTYLRLYLGHLFVQHVGVLCRWISYLVCAVRENPSWVRGDLVYTIGDRSSLFGILVLHGGQDMLHMTR